jgi:imidazolonepropionase-like amidohydrolase
LPDETVHDVHVVGGRLVEEGDDRAVTLVDDAWIVPGLVDAHAHLALSSPAGDDAPADERVLASARAQRDAGVLALREPGSPVDAADGLADEQGLPRIVTAGRFLAAPGGYIPGLAREVPAGDLAEAVAGEAADHGWVKIIMDFPGEHGRITPSFDDETLAAAVRTAHLVGARVAVHATVPEAIERAIGAGVDSLEHATMLRPEQLDDLATCGAALVPTMVIADAVLGLLASLGATDELTRVRAAIAEQPGIVRAAAERGVPVFAGTDAGMVAHGLVAEEVALLVAGGVPPDRALAGASWAAREWLGFPAVGIGASADLVVYRDDPRADVGVLRRPAAILRGGVLVAADARVGVTPAG